jgi:predicted dehydrogenase
MRYLVVGLGNIGQRRRALLGERCVATADPYNRAADYNGARDVPLTAYDAAILAIPDADKIDLATYLLEQGKHVLIEKPLLLPDRATAQRLERLAGARKLALYTAYNHRFEPLLVALKERLEAGAIGEVYHGRLFYGNGTVRHVAGTWRDHGLGVIADLGCHLLDLLAFVGLGLGTEMLLTAFQTIESRAPDRALITSADGRFTLEVMYHAWRNSFAFELYGSKGSIHCHGLRKWGGSELAVRTRVLPSGRPHETIQTDEGPDVTWERELEQFERLCADGATSLATDWWISSVLARAAATLAVRGGG